MAGVNVDNVGLTYVHILDGASETLNQASRARNKVSQNYEWRGSHLEHKLHMARNHAVGFMADGGAFPVADKEDYVSMKVGRKIVGGSIQLTDAVMATASKSPQVALDVVSAHTEGLMKNILKFENFFFSRDGSGVVGIIRAAASSGSSVSMQVSDARALWDGATYQVYDTTLATLKGTLVVSSVTSAPNSSGYAVFTASSLSTNVIAGDKIVWNGALNIAYSGLDLLIDDAATTFQNVAVGTYPRYSSMVLDNGGTLRDLSPALFRQLQAGIYQKSGSDLPVSGLSCLASASMLNNMDELYESNLRLSPDSSVSGVATPSFQSSLGKVSLEADADAPYNKIFLCDFSQIYRGVQKKLGWRMQGGQIFLRSDLSGNWNATAIEICEMYIKERNSSGKIEDLNESFKTAY